MAPSGGRRETTRRRHAAPCGGRGPSFVSAAFGIGESLGDSAAHAHRGGSRASGASYWRGRSSHGRLLLLSHWWRHSSLLLLLLLAHGGRHATHSTHSSRRRRLMFK